MPRKLTIDDIITVWNLHETGLKGSEIAKKTKLHVNTVYKIINNKHPLLKNITQYYNCVIPASEALNKKNAKFDLKIITQENLKTLGTGIIAKHVKLHNYKKFIVWEYNNPNAKSIKHVKFYIFPDGIYDATNTHLKWYQLQSAAKIVASALKYLHKQHRRDA